MTDLASTLEALAVKATPGEWMSMWHGDMHDGVSMYWLTRNLSLGTKREVDGDLICELRNNLPAIISALRTANRIEELGGENEKQVAALRKAKTLLGTIEQSISNVWWVDTTDPETLVCDTIEAVDAALKDTPDEQ